MGKEEHPLLPEASAEAVDAVPADATALDKVKAADAARYGFPGEHWLVLALGIGVWQFTRTHRNVLVRTAGGFAAAALVARAASGREGAWKILRYTPFGSKIDRCPPCDAQGRRART
jgi:hypothetical protein